MILSSILRTGDKSRYGLVQAVTETAHFCDKSKKYEEASSLEVLGGELVEMADERFSKLVAV